MKGYPITRDELFGLGGAGVLATTCFSVGGTYWNRKWDIKKDLELTKDITPELKARWDTKATEAGDFAFIMFIIGVVAVLAGGAKVISIIFSTKHPSY